MCGVSMPWLVGHCNRNEREQVFAKGQLAAQSDKRYTLHCKSMN